MQELDVNDLPALVAGAVSITGNDPDQEWWFRGHGRTSFSLVPSLYRTFPTVADALDVEGRILREFSNRSRTLVEAAGARDDEWELLFLMQHYRLPTRLLDWSRNLLIAAFFAVHDPEAWAIADDDPCVCVLNPREWNRSVIGPAGIAGSNGAVTSLNEGVMTSYRPQYSGRPVGALQEHAVAIAGPEFAARIVAQRGAFTVFGTKDPSAIDGLEAQNDHLVASAGASEIYKLILRGSQAEWKQTLALVGIGQFTAFPDLEGLASELRQRYEP